MTKNSKKRSFRSYFTNNSLLKIISIIFAILLWSFVTNSTDPQRTKTITDVPVVLQGLEALEEKGLTLRDDIEKILPSVDVKVNVKNSDYKLLNKNVVFVSIDVSEIEKDGPNSVTVVTTFSNMIDVSLSSVNPHTVNVIVDKLVSKEVPVTVNKINSLKDGLISLAPKAPETVTIKGSSYYVERIKNAFCELDLSQLNDGDTASLPCRFTDADGNTIKFPTVRVDVDPDVQSVKTVNISSTRAVVNASKVKKGFEYNGVSLGTVTVCGHLDVLNNISEISIQPIDLTDKDNTFTTASLEFILPDGISLLPGQVLPQAKVDIQEEKASVSKTCLLNVSGLSSEGKSATITLNGQTYAVTGDGSTSIPISVMVTGPKSVVNSLADGDVSVNLSLRDTAVGTHELKPVAILNALIAENVVAEITTSLQVSIAQNPQ